MVDEPDEKHLQGENKKPTPSPNQNHHTSLGLTTQEALKVLSDEIEEVVKSYEQNLHNER